RRTTRGRTEDVGVRRNDAEARCSELPRRRYICSSKKVRAKASNSSQINTSSSDNGTDGKNGADGGAQKRRRTAVNS
ncbi:MAG: hypothetical protein NT098_01090, partial [Candidatus Parcubacteria bacterium]|nr:hypothetical protein [Candidatus Parcubacteria bacterium]